MKKPTKNQSILLTLSCLLFACFGPAMLRVLIRIAQAIGSFFGGWLGYRPTFDPALTHVDKIAVGHWFVALQLVLFTTWFARWCLEKWKPGREFGKDMWKFFTIPYIVAPLGSLVVFLLLGWVADAFQWFLNHGITFLFGIHSNADWRTAVPPFFHEHVGVHTDALWDGFWHLFEVPSHTAPMNAPSSGAREAWMHFWEVLFGGSR